MTVGISKCEQTEDDWPELFTKLNDNFQRGKKHSWWYYYSLVDGFRDGNNDTLLKLRDPDTLDFFIEQFERIRAIAEPIIDGAMSQSQ